MTIVGTRRMIVYDDLQTLEKIRIYDVRVERPPHYDTFAEFHYSYHYGDSYIPHLKQEEPLETRVPALSRLHCQRRKAVDRRKAGTGACQDPRGGFCFARGPRRSGDIHPSA